LTCLQPEQALACAPMKGLRRFLIWGLIFCGLLAGMDQLLLKVPLSVPVLHEVQVFYRDFRSRLLALAGGSSGPSIEQLIGNAERTPPPARAHKPALKRPSTKPAARYLYVDQEGALQFSDSLQQVPKRFRSSAQPLKD